MHGTNFWIVHRTLDGVTTLTAIAESLSRRLHREYGLSVQPSVSVQPEKCFPRITSSSFLQESVYLLVGFLSDPHIGIGSLLSTRCILASSGILSTPRQYLHHNSVLATLKLLCVPSGLFYGFPSPGGDRSPSPHSITSWSPPAIIAVARSTSVSCPCMPAWAYCYSRRIV